MKFHNTHLCTWFTLQEEFCTYPTFIVASWTMQFCHELTQILPSLSNIPPGQLIDNDLLRSALHATPAEEFFDVEETGYLYSQRIDWKQYNNPQQLFTSEREFILGALLSNTPESVLKLQTFRDIFKIKDKGNHFKTKLQKISFIQKCGLELK